MLSSPAFNWTWVAIGLVALVPLGVLGWPTEAVEPRRFVVEEKLEPKSALRVLWVGHSLMNHRDPHVEASRNILEMVGAFAEERSLGYAAVDHTLFGAPLSLLWRGSPHSYSRSEPELPLRRQKHLEQAVDAVVLTEGIPVGRSLEVEHSAYYAHEFRCAVLARNPKARVYVYEAWSHLFASDETGDYPPPSTYDWSARLAADRAIIERLADTAATGHGMAPGPKGRLSRLMGSDSTCPPGNVYLVPVGSVYRELADVLSHEQLSFRGRPMTVRDLFANPYTDWPKGWPVAAGETREEEASKLSALELEHPGEPLDDIHPSQLGVHIAALVHFATLYGRSPEGLASPVAGLPEATARRLQEVVWKVVASDARTGLGANSTKNASTGSAATDSADRSEN